ncbi:hypothetical protein B0O99DRAFT_316093 [Bisporella sp. PMI_857]|nr:hypothetical protein B0O99DRAFT_316093 [Bisporella sp. PMI_857]
MLVRWMYCNHESLSSNFPFSLHTSLQCKTFEILSVFVLFIIHKVVWQKYPRDLGRPLAWYTSRMPKKWLDQPTRKAQRPLGGPCNGQIALCIDW